MPHYVGTHRFSCTDTAPATADWATTSDMLSPVCRADMLFSSPITSQLLSKEVRLVQAAAGTALPLEEMVFSLEFLFELWVALSLKSYRTNRFSTTEFLVLLNWILTIQRFIYLLCAKMINPYLAFLHILLCVNSPQEVQLLFQEAVTFTLPGTSWHHIPWGSLVWRPL